MQDQRINESENHQVVLAGGLLEKTASIVNVDTYPRISVRVIGMLSPANVEDLRIDLDCIDVFGPVFQGRCHVVARTCSDDQDILKGFAACIAVQQVR